MDVVADELVDLNPLVHGAPGSRQGVGLHYEVSAEFTLQKHRNEWLWNSGYIITTASIANSLQYEPEQGWRVTDMQCFGADDYPRLIRGAIDDAGLLWMQWPDHAPSCVVFACHETRDWTSRGRS